MNTTEDVPSRTAKERARQLAIWGEQDHPDGTSLANIDVAEKAQEACEVRFANGTGSWLDILLEEVFEASAEVDEEALITELIQVAAVAESWADSIRRRQARRAKLLADSTTLTTLSADDLAELRGDDDGMVSNVVEMRATAKHIDP